VFSVEHKGVVKGFVQRIIRRRPVLNVWARVAILLLFATSFVAAILLNYFIQLRTEFNALADFQCEAAVTAYETGGAQKLESVMHDHEAESGVRAYLFDKAGRNLAGGPNRATLLAVRPFYVRALERLKGQPIPGDHARVVSGVGYPCVVVAVGVEHRAFYETPSVWILAFLAMLSYGIAGNVVLKMRRLETAIRTFGTGKLEIRLPAKSGGPIRHLTDAFNQMASQVESLLDAHKRLCIDVSHELRSPLTRLKLAIGLARSGTSGAVEQIELEASRLNELVDQLLDVARAEVDPTAFRPEKIDIESLLIEVVDECSIEARERGCDLDLRLDDSGSVSGDPELLRRAVENPVRNAIRHSPSGSHVEVACKGTAEFAVISIRDWGPGVPATAIQEIFKPFYRVESDRDRDTGGTGLGLAIVERIVTLHHGSVTAVNSAPGLRVEIRIPRH
jgi:two-component system sensor histidine kinase CpxA